MCLFRTFAVHTQISVGNRKISPQCIETVNLDEEKCSQLFRHKRHTSVLTIFLLIPPTAQNMTLEPKTWLSAEQANSSLSPDHQEHWIITSNADRFVIFHECQLESGSIVHQPWLYSILSIIQWCINALNYPAMIVREALRDCADETSAVSVLMTYWFCS